MPRQSYGVSLGRNGFETPHPSLRDTFPSRGRLEQSESLTGSGVNDSPVDCQSRAVARVAMREGFWWARYLLSKRDINSLQN